MFNSNYSLFSDFFLHLRPPYMILCVLPWTPTTSGAVILHSLSCIEISFSKLSPVFFKWLCISPVLSYKLFSPGKLMSSTFIWTFWKGSSYFVYLVHKLWDNGRRGSNFWQIISALSLLIPPSFKMFNYSWKYLS